MIYMIDVDGTICENKNSDYENSTPLYDRIEKINRLYDEGHTINYWTARGNTTGIDWKHFTEQQLKSWGCKYHSFNTKKPSYDVWVDDKAMSDKEFFK